MKKSQTGLVRNKGVGTLINEFDALPVSEQTVGMFNYYFPSMLIHGFDRMALITIGEVVPGNRREITITGEKTATFHHSFDPVTVDGRVLNCAQAFSLYYPNGDYIGHYLSIAEAAECFGICKETFQKRIGAGELVKDIS